MPLRTRRWNDPGEPDDGFRVLVCRFRPRGVAKARETWDAWWPDLGPSPDLLAAYKAKDGGDGIPWSTYEHRYLGELERQSFLIRALVSRLRAGETVTLLCSSSCHDPAHCHRTLLARVVEAALRRPVR